MLQRAFIFLEDGDWEVEKITVVAKGLGVEDYVDSPTFTIVKEYDEGLVRRLIESITIYDDHIMVTFKSGIKIDVTA